MPKPTAFAPKSHVPPRWGNVAIVGVGLLGGSIGLALRERGVARKLIGIGRSSVTLERAKRLGAVDEVSTDLASTAAAELVIICTPVETIAEHVRRIAEHTR